MREVQTQTPDGGILHDQKRLPTFLEAYFSPDYWAEKNRLEGAASGRGVVHFISSDHGNWALRHYRRGGLMANLLKDRYWFSGKNRTRSFREWRLLAHLRHLGLPVPAPIAARFVRVGLYYQADLITARLEEARAFSTSLLSGESAVEDLGFEVGRCIRQFHDAKVNHADLNVHNIMLAPGQVYLLDFDKGTLESEAGSWQEQNLQRLRRSLRKVGASAFSAKQCDDIWQSISRGYRNLPR